MYELYLKTTVKYFTWVYTVGSVLLNTSLLCYISEGNMVLSKNYMQFLVSFANYIKKTYDEPTADKFYCQYFKPVLWNQKPPEATDSI